MTDEPDTAIVRGRALDETTLHGDAAIVVDGEGSLPGAAPECVLRKRGSTVDRDVIVALLGAGGIGVAYVADEPNPIVGSRGSCGTGASSSPLGRSAPRPR